MRTDTPLPPQLSLLVTHACVLLRSAGRGVELDGLAQLVHEQLGVHLPVTGLGAKVALPSEAPGQAAATAYALRTRPSEIMLLVAAHNTVIHPQTLERIASLRQATAESPLLHAVDADQALKAFALTGSLARDLLVRVADATSLPKGVGQFTRLRLADVHATLVWDASERYLIIVDRLYAEFFRERLHHAAEPLDFHPSWAQAT